MIIVTHAYSRSNIGDGFLVDATIDLIESALPGKPIGVLALHADTFGDLSRVYQYRGVPLRARTVSTFARALTSAIGVTSAPQVGPNGVPVEFIVGVGGGYLRTGHCVEALKTGAVHLPQLQWASSTGAPTIYLPQSIGPLRGPIGGMIRKSLAKIDCVAARDDRTLAELQNCTRVYRFPDLAVMEVARTVTGVNTALPYKTFLIARDLPRSGHVLRDYYERLQRLRNGLPNCEIIAQSSAHGNDDASFYERLGWGSSFRSTADLLHSGEKGVVVSVRLHGALQCIAAGLPAIHLSYERKGFGAYEDLNIPHLVSPSTAFDPEAVATQAKSILADPDIFWAPVYESKNANLATRRSLIELIQSVYSGTFSNTR